MRTAALVNALVLLAGLLFGPGVALAYPATAGGDAYIHSSGATNATLGGLYDDVGPAACASQSGAPAYGSGCIANITSPETPMRYQWYHGAWGWQHFTYGTKTYGPTYTCPNGGTLSGTTCTCSAGYNDTGTACESICDLATQWWNSETSSCAGKCPAAGTGWTENDHPLGSTSGGIAFPKGSSYACQPSYWGPPPAGTAQCQVENSSMVTVCDAESCWGEHARYTGNVCGSEAGEVTLIEPVDDVTPTVCEEGDLWCLSSGSCGAGYTSGTVNDTAICAKVGEPMTINPQAQSANAPVMNPSPQPNSWTNPSARPGESINSSSRVVVSIGGAATQFPGTGSGGGGGEGDGECGLTDSTKCKIDESGTPNGSGVDGGQDGVNAGAGQLGDALDDVVSGTTKPENIGWGITSIMFPTNCSPFVIGPFGNWGQYTIDFCQFQPIVHDLMSMVWASFGLIFSVGMVFRTVTTGGA